MMLAAFTLVILAIGTGCGMLIHTQTTKLKGNG
jgi:hypothetical protein